MCVGVCMCGFCNVCVCVDFVKCVCVFAFCNLCLCVCVDLVMFSVYVWVL